MQDAKDDEWYYLPDEEEKFMRSPRVPFDDELRGTCSGIPTCCINFYIMVWSPNDNPAKDCPEHQMLMDEAKREGFKFYYIPCPACLKARRFVEIKQCSNGNCFCGQWERREAMKGGEQDRKKRRRRRMARKKQRGYV